MTDAPETVNAPAYRVLARKYRPKDFAGLIGQDAMVRTLTNAIATNRIAQAYMLTGVRGIGKTTTARLIARALNYPGRPTIDMAEVTPQCEAILESRHMDVIEMDAASNTGVDNMREIIDSVRYAPVSLRYKIYIIDEVHMLSKSAFNALLKTLEEPPPHVKFIFATTEIRKVPVTILSRCQRFDLKRLDASLLMQHYQRIATLENVTIDEASLRMIARASEGSVRDGLSLLDQAIAYGEGLVKSADVASMMGLIDKSRIIEVFDAVMSGDTARAIHEMEAQYEGGGDPETILNDLADFVHWVTRLKVVKDSALLDASRTEVEKARGMDYAQRIGMAHLARAWQMLLKGIAEVSHAAQPLMAAEMVLIRLAHAADFPQGEDLLKATKQPATERSAPIMMPQGAKREAPVTETIGSLAVKPDIQSTQPPTQTRAFAAFSDIIALVDEKRDVKLKGDLERHVRPIRISLGQVELALEPGASPGLPGELSRKLEAWTGRRWMVLVAREGGATPLAQQKKDARESAFREVREDVSVQAILKRFPGATVTDVRDPETLKPTEENDEEPR